MKKYLIIILALLFTTLMSAQHQGGTHKGPNKQERAAQVAAQKAAYLTARIGLDATVAEKFWPVYHKAQAEMKEVRAGLRKELRQSAQVDLSDDAVRELMDKKFAAEEKELALKRKYHQQYLKLLTPRQVAALYRSEEEFKREILRELKHRGGRRKR